VNIWQAYLCNYLS